MPPPPVPPQRHGGYPPPPPPGYPPQAPGYPPQAPGYPPQAQPPGYPPVVPQPPGPPIPPVVPAQGWPPPPPGPPPLETPSNYDSSPSGYSSSPAFEADPAPAFQANPRQIRSHGKRKHRVPIWMVIIVVAGLAVVGAGLVFVPGSPFARDSSAGTPEETPFVPPTHAPTPLPFRSTEITPESVGTKGFLSWALLDRRSGEIIGSANKAETTTTASMVKAWLASDYLRRAEEGGQTPPASRLADLETLIRDSDNDAADRTFTANGKTDSIDRLITMCNLTDAKAVKGFWSNTIISAQDTVRMGACIGDGRAAGEKWTPWVLDMMRKVRGTGDFGIRKALPAAAQAQVSIKNGWLLRDEDNKWHTNCMAIGDTWVLSVLQQYPSQGAYEADFEHTAGVCQQVATQLLNPAA